MKLQNTSPKKQKSYLAVIAMILAMSAVLAVYLYGVNEYKTHFLPNTVINNSNWSDCSVDEVTEKIEANVQRYNLSISPRESDSVIVTADEIALHFNSPEEIQKIVDSQNEFEWPLSYFKSYSYNAIISVGYDSELLEQRIEQFPFLGDFEREPVNANLKYSEADKRYIVVPEDEGTKVNRNMLRSAIEECIEKGDTSLALDEVDGMYETPSLTAESESLQKALKSANVYTAGKVTYELPDAVEVVDSDMIASWLNVNAKKGKVSLDKQKVKDYITTLATRYDTLSVPKKFKTQRGDVVTVNGFYGWKIDKEAETKKLISNIKKGKSESREPVYSHRAEGSGENEFGSTYAEVDLTNQKMHLVKNKKCVLTSDVVTGNVSLGRETPTGIYQISYKDRNAVLRGQRRKDGSYAYESPVSYWMPFNQGIGFHDANWRSSFGGSIYKTNGSHGCVNMPPSKARQLYDYVYAGMVVVVYN